MKAITDSLATNLLEHLEDLLEFLEFGTPIHPGSDLHVNTRALRRLLKAQLEAMREDGPCIVCGEYDGDHVEGCTVADAAEKGN